MSNTRPASRAADRRGVSAGQPSPDTPQTRVATQRDAGQIGVLWRTAIPGAWSQASIETLLGDANAALWVAPAEGERSVGFLAGRAVANRFEVLALAVSRAHRRAGVGASLLARAVAEARLRSCRFVDLEVGASNREALALYGGHGFVAVGRRPRYYEGGEDALLMTREITDV